MNVNFKLISVSLFLLLLFSSVYAVDIITLEVGETQNRKLFIYNPSGGMTDIVDLKISSTGSANAWVTTTQANRMEVTILPQENKSIPITVIATSCTESGCTGEVNFIANSTVTGNSVTKKISVLIGDEDARGGVAKAPGLNPVYIVLIAIFGSLISLKFLKNNPR